MAATDVLSVSKCLLLSCTTPLKTIFFIHFLVYMSRLLIDNHNKKKRKIIMIYKVPIKVNESALRRVLQGHFKKRLLNMGNEPTSAMSFQDPLPLLQSSSSERLSTMSTTTPVSATSTHTT